MIDETHNHPELGRLTRTEIAAQTSDRRGPWGATNLVFTEAEKVAIDRIRLKNGLKPKFGASEAPPPKAVNASPSGKPTSRANQPAKSSINVSALKAQAFAEGFRSASSRMKAVMATPVAKSNPDLAIDLLAHPKFASWSATRLANGLRDALKANQDRMVASWDEAHAAVDESRGKAAANRPATNHQANHGWESIHAEIDERRSAGGKQ